ncbi:MAG: putative microtubial binding protein [Streblomastix strix]|uniref:Autophagy-related protein n=1 Tax=Streblomastix strix TaxID=222440 RepID=A0A5J4W4D5_9EUKA|nr:MAG: putative microtubial binding protein [Streblomastix strix]
MIKESPFKSKYPLNERKAEADILISKYPDRVPVICERVDGSDIPEMDNKKFTVDPDMTIGGFQWFLRKYLKLGFEKRIFVFIDNAIPPIASVMCTLYAQYRWKHPTDDGFLYITYSGEYTLDE